MPARIALVLGTRPEIIKMAPLVRECQRRALLFFMLYTGQHYSYEMDRVFFEELSLPQPEHDLLVGSGRHGEQTAKILAGVERILLEEMPGLVLVLGDTNSTLAAALAAAKLPLTVGHIEAGLRSGDRRMPEELNRTLTDHLSDYLFAPTEGSRRNLQKEGIPPEKVFVTGNTIVDAVYQHLEIARTRSAILSQLNLRPREYFLVTAHRQENADNQERLKGILEGLELLSQRFGLPVVFPIHPRTKKRLGEFGLQPPRGVRVLDPLGFLEFLQLEAEARLVLTDSGGVQEEACILKVPCVILRDNTERPETVEVGASTLSGCEPLPIMRSVETMMARDKNWENPFGDGHAAERIMSIISKRAPSPLEGKGEGGNR